MDGTAITTPWRGMPPGKLKAKEYYNLYIFAEHNVAGVKTSRSIYHTLTSPVDRTITLPNAIDPNSLTWNFTSTGSNVTSKIEWIKHIDSTYGAPKSQSITLSQGSVQWEIAMSDSSWFTANNLVYETPDFSGIEGWDMQFSISQGSEVALQFISQHTDRTLADIILRNTPADGTQTNLVEINLLATP